MQHEIISDTDPAPEGFSWGLLWVLFWVLLMVVVENPLSVINEELKHGIFSLSVVKFSTLLCVVTSSLVVPAMLLFLFSQVLMSILA